MGKQDELTPTSESSADPVNGELNRLDSIMAQLNGTIDTRRSARHALANFVAKTPEGKKKKLKLAKNIMEDTPLEYLQIWINSEHNPPEVWEHAEKLIVKKERALLKELFEKYPDEIAEE